MHERQVNHGHLVDDNHICLQRILPVPHKTTHRLLILRIYIDFQQTVDCLSLIPRGLCHPFRRASGRRCEKQTHSLTLKETNHRVNSSCFSRTRSSGQDEKTVFDRLDDRPVLHLIQLNLFGIFYLFKAPFHQILRHLTVNVQVMKHLRRV